LSNILLTQRATFNLTGIAFVWEFVIIIEVILLDEQYKQSDVMHFRTSSTIKEFASWDFLNNLIKMAYKKGSIAFFNA
jgi:hypothetical protein